MNRVKREIKDSGQWEATAQFWRQPRCEWLEMSCGRSPPSFAAIAAGRARLGGFGMHAIAGGVVVWLAATWAHGPLAGWAAGIWRWIQAICAKSKTPLPVRTAAFFITGSNRAYLPAGETTLGVANVLLVFGAGVDVLFGLAC